MRVCGRARLSDEERGLIDRIGTDTATEVRKHLADLEDDLRLVVQFGPAVIPETGEVGAAVAPGVVAWTVDDTRPEGVTSIAERFLRHTLFHELHHLVRGWTFYGGAEVTGLVQGVVSEGLATAFARDAGGEAEAPWATYPDDVTDWVSELLVLPTTADYQQWMFLHPDGRRWLGYKAGTYLADAAIARSGRSAAELVAVDWEQVVALAGFSVPAD
jgi:hypothetical protein